MNHPLVLAITTIVITLLLRAWNIPAVRDVVFARVGKLPRALQFVAPLSLAVLAAAGQGWIDGLRGTALFERAMSDGGQIGAMAIGLWHTAKRVGWSKVAEALAAPKNGPPITPS
jgi:hypothetical protein